MKDNLYNGIAMNKIKPQTLKKSQIAVFIDAANFEISLKQSSLWADYKKLLKFIRKDVILS